MLVVGLNFESWFVNSLTHQCKVELSNVSFSEQCLGRVSSIHEWRKKEDDDFI